MRSPLAPASQPDLPPITGVKLAAMAAGLKYRGRDDLLLLTFAPGTRVAGVLTKSACASAPVDWCRDHLGRGTARAVVVNAGNANAFTGQKGARAAQMTAQAAALAVGCEAHEVFLASTGVIGEPLDATAFGDHLSTLATLVSDDGWARAAGAIMTTDTFSKVATAAARIGDQTVTINGIAKGSGMIAPDMATMLGFVATDAPVSSAALQTLLSRETDRTFNAVTVDSDTSTSDTVLAFATGSAGEHGELIENADDSALDEFRQAFAHVMRNLAMQIVRDGEGATKLVSVDIRGAVSDASARAIAMSVANSPLVKTAIAGEDANWGRIVMAVGKAGQPADRDKLSIWFGDVKVAHEGERAPDYSEEAASLHMQGQEVKITVELGMGDGSYTAYTCDLTKRYIEINGDYRS
ncbi:MAG: bifunctional glutamate N-acetyltransferase/amino-acid acetyltransferase ArgJ [Pseudomonadota bacterium]